MSFFKKTKNYVDYEVSIICISLCPGAGAAVPGFQYRDARLQQLYYEVDST